METIGRFAPASPTGHMCDRFLPGYYSIAN
jgi:hypothetical protein